MLKIKQFANRYACPVCGFGLEYPPNDFNICPSCGVEFDYETAGRSFSELRHEWVANGAHWASRVDRPPKDWNPYLQLILAGYIYDVPFPADVHPAQSAVSRGAAIVTSGTAIGPIVHFT